MIDLNPPLLDDSTFDFEMNRDGIVQVEFGPTRVRLELDAAYELQYRLAEFLASVEHGAYDHLSDAELGSLPSALPEHPFADERAIGSLCEEHGEIGRSSLDSLAGLRRPRRMH